MNVRSNGMLCLMLFIILVLLTACGGGGSGGGHSNSQDGVQALTYNGNEDPAALDATNIEELTKGAMGLNLMEAGDGARELLPSALSRSLLVAGLTGADEDASAARSMVRSFSDGVTRSAAGEVVGYAMEDLLGDILLEELHDRLSDDNFPSVSGPSTVIVGSWIYDDASGRYDIVIQLNEARHCSVEGIEGCIETFDADGTITISMAFDAPPSTPPDLAELMNDLDENDSDHELITVTGSFNVSDLENDESMAVTGTLENYREYNEDGLSYSERYQGTFFGDITFISEAITIMATNCVILTASGETCNDEEDSRSGYYDTNLNGNVSLVVTENGATLDESRVITVELTNGSLQAEEEWRTARVDFHSGTSDADYESSALTCSGRATVAAKEVTGATETQVFTLDLELGELAFVNDRSSDGDGDDWVIGSSTSLELQASLSFTSGGTAFSLEDLDLSFAMRGSSIDCYTAEGAYEGYESSNRVDASLSGELSVLEEGEQVFAIQAPVIGGAPNMTLLVESNYSNTGEVSTSENHMNLHAGRLSIIDQGAAFIYGGDFDLTQTDEGVLAVLSLVATNPAGVTTFMDNYRISAVPTTYEERSATEVTVNGTFYHSVHGAVSVTTGPSFVFFDGGWPVAGSLIVTSTNDVAGQLEATDGQYRILGDMNGDGDFEGDGDFAGSQDEWPIAPWDMVMSILPMGLPR